MKQAILKKGIVYPRQTPAPKISKGNLLVRVVSSCVSAGTEMSSVKSSEKNIVQRVFQQPENLKKAIDSFKSKGLASTFNVVKDKLDNATTLGYSASGIVEEIGEGVEGFNIGDHVAIAGLGYANHAEFAEVPKNLIVKKPLTISFQEASGVALGAIAIQGVRRAALNFGELCVVVGAGILGLLTLQILKASGVRVCVLDLDEKRLGLATNLGAELALNPLNDNSVDKVINWSDGRGVDCAIFTAATTSSEPLSDAFKMCKRKGVVILVGVSGMEINRADIYQKELDFKISTSYGPGRYDKQYEEKGHDYPFAYVRWTEQRNMQEYLRLIASGAINLDQIISAEYSIDNVTTAYESLKQELNKPLMVVLNYSQEQEAQSTIQHRIYNNSNKKLGKGDEQVKVALVGAGAFATSIHLPNIDRLPSKFSLHAVCNRSGNKAVNVAERFGAKYSTTNYEELLSDDEVDLVLIATRHDSHGDLALQALKAGKHVFVEKPLTSSQEELDKIKSFYSNGIESKPILFVGFNRRFSKYAQEIKRHTDKRVNPVYANYSMNAGFAPSDSWIHEDGGRIVGEGCHIIDLMSFITGSKIKSICVESLTPTTKHFKSSDNKAITLKYIDGSVCVINYFSVGNKLLSKEILEVHFDGKSIVLDDYKKLMGYGVEIKALSSNISEKGQLEELIVLYDALRGNSESWPISLDSLIETTEITFIAKDC